MSSPYCVSNSRPSLASDYYQGQTFWWQLATNDTLGTSEFSVGARHIFLWYSTWDGQIIDNRNEQKGIALK